MFGFFRLYKLFSVLLMQLHLCSYIILSSELFNSSNSGIFIFSCIIDEQKFFLNFFKYLVNASSSKFFFQWNKMIFFFQWNKMILQISKQFNYRAVGKARVRKRRAKEKSATSGKWRRSRVLSWSMKRKRVRTRARSRRVNDVVERE